MQRLRAAILTNLEISITAIRDNQFSCPRMKHLDPIGLFP